MQKRFSASSTEIFSGDAVVDLPSLPTFSFANAGAPAKENVAVAAISKEGSF